MPGYIISIAILLICNFHPAKLIGQKHFSNQGEQEDYWATELFKNSYSKQTFERFNGEIIALNNYKIQYDSTVLKVFTDDLLIKQIFTSGIFYPDIFDDPRTFDTSIRRIRMEAASISKEEKIPTDSSTLANNAHFRDLIQNDTISISVVEEVAFLSNSPKAKRFRMWVNHRWMPNPTVYFFELSNDNATINTSLAEFIKAATLTFMRKGWMII
jgi:predicted RNA-binding protein